MLSMKEGRLSGVEFSRIENTGTKIIVVKNTIVVKNVPLHCTITQRDDSVMREELAQIQFFSIFVVAHLAS